MRTVFICALFVLMLLTSNTGFSQSPKLDSVKIEFQGFSTETDIRVTCETFNGMFLKTKITKVIYQKKNLLHFESLRENFKLTKIQSLDVRGEITYYYGTQITKYCFDKFGYFYHDGKVYSSKKLLIAISENLYGNYPRYLDTLTQQ